MREHNQLLCVTRLLIKLHKTKSKTSLKKEMRLFTRLLVTVELVNSGWQFPPSQLSRQPRAHSPRKELSRRSRSLHQDLFLSREARDNEEVDEESNRLSQAHPLFSRMLEHSWQPEVGDSICSSQFVPNICACSSGDTDRSKHQGRPPQKKSVLFRTLS